MDNWNAHPSKMLLDAIHDAHGHAAAVERRVLTIADKLADVGLDKLADECAAAVAGLEASVKRARDAHMDSQNHDLRESERGIASMLTAIVEGCIVPPKKSRTNPTA